MECTGSRGWDRRGLLKPEVQEPRYHTDIGLPSRGHDFNRNIERVFGRVGSIIELFAPGTSNAVAIIGYGRDGVKRGDMKFLLIGSALIILWVVGVFVTNITTGWVHIPLAVGTVLMAIGIVVSGERQGEQ